MKRRKLKKRKVAKRTLQRRKASKQPIATQFFGYKNGSWVWCRDCQRCYRVGEHRNGSDGLEYCRYQDCNADAVFSVNTWETVRHFYPHYPEVPERNTVYQCDVELGGVW